MSISSIVGTLVTGVAMRAYGILAAIYVASEVGDIVQAKFALIGAAFPL